MSGTILMPVPKRQWRAPSQAQPKDQFGRENETVFRLTGRLNDGHVRWRGWFKDRDDADAFLFAMASGSLVYERELWRLPTPCWHPDLGDFLSYDFVTQVFLTSSPGGNQTYTSPADWDNTTNEIHTIGAGGGGGKNRRAAGLTESTGGGGGAWNETTGFTFATPGTTTATYQIGSGGTGSTGTAAGVVNGGLGGDTWFNSATLAGSSVGSKGGSGGTGGTSTISATAGGVGASGTGTSSNDGGASGAITSTGFSAATGAGGAAGPNGNGGNGTAGGGAGQGTAGGRGDSASGGSGGGTASFGTAGNNGGAGTEWDATHGSGGGGSGATYNSGSLTSGAGGNYGAASGGLTSQGGAGTITVPDGKQGIIYLSYGSAVVTALLRTLMGAGV